MACLSCCVPKFQLVDDVKEEPLVDLEKVILAIALKQLKLTPPTKLTWREKLCPLKKSVSLFVDRSFLGIQTTGEWEVKEQEVNAHAVSPTMVGHPSRMTVLFESHIQNDTDKDQVSSFKTERQTTSSLEISLQRGFTIGKSLDLELKLPAGMPGCEVSGKLGTHQQWSFERGKVSRKEDMITWSVDSQITVPKRRTGTAQLRVSECRWSTDFTMPVHLRPRTRTGKIPVFVRRRASGELLQVINVACEDVVKEIGGLFQLDEGDGGIRCDLRGHCRLVCAVRQEISLHDAQLVVPALTVAALAAP